MVQTLNGSFYVSDQAYAISEVEIQFCPNFCSKISTVHGFCEEHEPDYVKAFAAEVRSERCCDEKKCQGCGNHMEADLMA